jgi:hypothetical protein
MLRRRHIYVDFPTTHHLACSGASATPPDPTAQDPNKWLHNQVSYVLDHLPNQPTVVSITIGANDFGWADPLNFVQHLFFQQNADFDNWVEHTATTIGLTVQTEVLRLFLSPNGKNLRVVITMVGNPFNRGSKFFLLPQNACYGQCYDRTERLVHRLNEALASVRGRTGDRVGYTLTLHQDFHGHEAPHIDPSTLSCGNVWPPDTTDTWIQYPGEDQINSDLPVSLRGLLGIEAPFGDCIHPNDFGATEYAKAVTDTALQLLQPKVFLPLTAR